MPLHYLQDAFGNNGLYEVDAISNMLAMWNSKHELGMSPRQYVWEIAIYPNHIDDNKTLVTLLNSGVGSQVSAVCDKVSVDVCAGLIRQALLIWPAPEILYFDRQSVPLSADLRKKLEVLGIEAKHSAFEEALFASRWPLAEVGSRDAYIFDEYSQHPWLLHQYWKTFSSMDLINGSFTRLFDFLLPEAGENQGFVTVESDGVYIGGERFFMQNLHVYEGYSVFCRQDPVNTSLVLMFSSISRQFLGELYCG